MSDPRRDRAGETTSTPIWLRAFGIAVLIAVVLVVVVMLAGGGHSPQPHGPP